MSLSNVTHEQIAELKEAYSLLVQKGSTTITATDLEMILASIGHHVTLRDIEEMIAQVDQSGSGTIEFEEFLVIIARRIITTQGEMELEQALLLFKPDESGRVPCVDIRTMLGAYGEQPLKPDELEELLRLADPGGTGYCTVEALRSLPCWRLPIPADSGPT